MYITTQIIQRELDSRLLLSAHLTALGHTVSFGPRPALHAHWRIHGPGVYVLSNAARKWFTSQPESDALRFVVLDEEVLLIDDEDELAQRLDVEVVRRTARHFCWGTNDYHALTRAVPDARNRLRMTGNPRVELLEPRFHSIYTKEVERIHREHGERYVLVNSNLLESEEDPWHSGMRDLIQGLARELATHRQDVTVIFRPHPADLQECSLETHDLPNLVVRSEGPIAPWLVGATAVFHNSCTTGVEARISERPVFAYRPMPDPDYGSLANSLSVTVRSVEEARAALDAVLAGDVPEHPDLAPLDRFLVRPGSGEPSRRIAEEIAGLTVPEAANGPERPGPFERLKIRWKGAPAKPWNRIALRERLPEIRERYALIAAAARLKHSVRIRAPQPSLIDIAPR